MVMLQPGQQYCKVISGSDGDAVTWATRSLGGSDGDAVTWATRL